MSSAPKGAAVPLNYWPSPVSPGEGFSLWIFLSAMFIRHKHPVTGAL